MTAAYGDGAATARPRVAGQIGAAQRVDVAQHGAPADAERGGELVVGRHAALLASLGQQAGEDLAAPGRRRTWRVARRPKCPRHRRRARRPPRHGPRRADRRREADHDRAPRPRRAPPSWRGGGVSLRRPVAGRRATGAAAPRSSPLRPRRGAHPHRRDRRRDRATRRRRDARSGGGPPGRTAAAARAARRPPTTAAAGSPSASRALAIPTSVSCRLAWSPSSAWRAAAASRIGSASAARPASTSVRPWLWRVVTSLRTTPARSFTSIDSAKWASAPVDVAEGPVRVAEIGEADRDPPRVVGLASDRQRCPVALDGRRMVAEDERHATQVVEVVAFALAVAEGAAERQRLLVHLASRCVVAAAPVRRPQVVQRPRLPAGRAELLELLRGGGMVLRGDVEVALRTRRSRRAGRSPSPRRAGLRYARNPARASARRTRRASSIRPRARNAAAESSESAARSGAPEHRRSHRRAGDCACSTVASASANRPVASCQRDRSRPAVACSNGSPRRGGRGLEPLERVALGVTVGQDVQGAHQAAERDPSDLVALADVQGPTEVRDGEREARRREGGDARLDRVAARSGPGSPAASAWASSATT